MKAIVSIALAILAALTVPVPADAADQRITVVAAENFYGDVAQQIGGDRVSVVSILNNPDQDPHLFETSPKVVREIADADVIVANGADYDPWMRNLIGAAPKPGRIEIVAADLVHKQAGDNPHLWYDPPTMPAVATALAAAFARIDPSHADAYATRQRSFLGSLAPLQRKIAAMAAKFAGIPVAATEPVFGYMAAALGLDMLDQRLQLAVMNSTEPSPRDVARLEGDVQAHRIRVLFYNKQASDRLVQHLVDLAHRSNVPVVGVTETCPVGLSFQDWMMQELDDTAKALTGSSS